MDVHAQSGRFDKTTLPITLMNENTHKLICMNPNFGTINPDSLIQKFSSFSEAEKIFREGNTNGMIITGWILGDCCCFWKEVFVSPLLASDGTTIVDGIKCSVLQMAKDKWWLTPVDDVYIPVLQDSAEYFESLNEYKEKHGYYPNCV